MPDLPLNCIVASFNTSSTILAAIASLTGFDRVLVCDDGSTDDSVAKVLHTNAELIQTKHRGFAAARNMAIAHLDYQGYITSFDADDVRFPVASEQRYLMETFELDVLLSPITIGGRIMTLTGNVVLDILGTCLHSSGIMVRGDRLLQLHHSCGEVWNTAAKCRTENWLLLDLLRFNPRIGYSNHPVCDWRPGPFTRSVHPGDRLTEFVMQACELRLIVGAAWKQEYENHVTQMAIALEYQAKRWRSLNDVCEM